MFVNHFDWTRRESKYCEMLVAAPPAREELSVLHYNGASLRATPAARGHRSYSRKKGAHQVLFGQEGNCQTFFFKGKYFYF